MEEIPRMEGMNRILKEIGWAAVSVDGFIPPNAFMEFQAHNTLVIAADIRTIDHIEYTPAPDIIHEAAGHAPIICSAFSGVADPNSYGLYFDPPKEKTHKIHFTPKEMELNQYYFEVRKMRINDKLNIDKLHVIFNKLAHDFPEDWLLSLEIYELFKKVNHEILSNKVLAYLKKNLKIDLFHN